MKEIILFLKSFKSRDGVSILISSLLVKVIGLLLAIIMVRILHEKEYGYIAYALSIIGILSAFSGLGMNWSLLRYGPVLNSIKDKKLIFKKSLKTGTFYTLILIILVIIYSFFLPQNFKEAQVTLIIISFVLLGNFFLELKKSFFRIIKRNKIFSQLNILSSLIIFISGIVLVIPFDGIGYAIALVVAPLITYFIYNRKINYRLPSNIYIFPKGYINYGLFTGLGTVSNQAMILMGPLLLAYYGALPENVAGYKVATIIPFNLVIIPSMIFTTDFVHLSENYLNKKLLKKYYVDYVKTISAIVIVPFIIFLFIYEWFFTVVFGVSYQEFSVEFFVLTIGIIVAFFLRIPLGNILSAVGKASWNVYNTVFWISVFIPSSYFGYLNFGILGVAASLSGIFILSGVVGLFLFLWYLKTIK